MSISVSSLVGGKISPGQVELPDERIQVFAVPASEPKKTDLIAIRTDAEGQPLGSPVFLHRTTGKVLAVIARVSPPPVDPPAIWVAWIGFVEKSGESGTSIVAALRTTATLSMVSRPITFYHGPGPQQQDPEPEFLAGVVTSQGGLAVSYALDDEELHKGGRHIDHVNAEGTVQKLGDFRRHGGDGGDAGIVDLGGTVLAWSLAYVGGPNWEEKFFPYAAGAVVPKLQVPDCDHPPMYRYWNGRELITYCPRDYVEDSQPCAIRRTIDSSNFCALGFAQRLDGTVLTTYRKDLYHGLVPITADREVCVAGRWRRELAWGRVKVRLTPDPPPAAQPTRPRCQPGATRPYTEG